MENIWKILTNFSGKYLEIVAKNSGKYLIETHKTNNRKRQIGRLQSPPDNG